MIYYNLTNKYIGQQLFLKIKVYPLSVIYFNWVHLRVLFITLYQITGKAFYFIQLSFEMYRIGITY